MLLGEDLAVGQVEMCPVVCKKSVTSIISEMSDEMSELYPECVVSRSIAKGLKRSLRMQSGSSL